MIDDFTVDVDLGLGDVVLLVLEAHCWQRVGCLMIDFVNFAVDVEFVLGDVVLQIYKACRKSVNRER